MDRKREILEAAGFKYIPDRCVWLNRDSRVALSDDTISDHDENWLHSRVSETVPENEFWFHFRFISDDPMRGCKEMLALLKLTRLTPVIRSGIKRVQ